MGDGLRSDSSGKGNSRAGIWLPPAVLAVLIVLLSSAPGRYYPRHPDFLNSVAHFTEFGLLGFFLARALHPSRSLTYGTLFFWTTLLCVLFGLLDELHQFLVPERMFGLTDLLYDFLGAASGSLTYIALQSRKAGRSRTAPAAPGGADE